jgi:hypothetical protein
VAKTVEEVRQYNREWHKKHAKRRTQVQTERKRANMQKFFEYKKSLSCVRCGFSDYRALQFHHLHGKLMNVSQMSKSYSWGRVLDEIGKCEVLCANCHMIEHHPD